MNGDIEDIIVQVTNEINKSKRRLTSNEGTCHGDVDRGDEENKNLKGRISVLKEVREKLEGLL